MKRVLVVGAGAPGGPCASILAGEPGVQEVRLGDIDRSLAQRVVERIGSGGVIPLKLDASHGAELDEAARGVAVVINLTHLRYHDTIMDAALAAGAH